MSDLPALQPRAVHSWVRPKFDQPGSIPEHCKYEMRRANSQNFPKAGTYPIKWYDSSWFSTWVFILAGGLQVFDIFGDGGFVVRVLDLRAFKAIVASAFRVPKISAGLEQLWATNNLTVISNIPCQRIVSLAKYRRVRYCQPFHLYG